MKLIFWINKLKLNTSSEINVILYRYIWLTQWKSFQKRINGNSFQDNVAISSSENFAKTRIYLSTCSDIVDYMLLMISFTCIFQGITKKGTEKVKLYFKHDDHVNNQDWSSYFLSRVLKYISNIGKISIFF